MGKSTIIALIASVIALNSVQADSEQSARFNLNNINDFVAEKASVFVMKKRTVDPFGKHQDPNRKIEAPKTKPANKPIKKEEQKILIENEIEKLSKQINILSGSAIIGRIRYKRGDKISVSVKGKVFPLKFLSIKKTEIVFLDLTDNNIITLNISKQRVVRTPSDKRPRTVNPKNDPINIRSLRHT